MVYATTAQVRGILPTMLKDEDDVGKVEAGTYIELTNPVYTVPTILQDGTELTLDTDYSFTRPKAVTLNSAASGEHYIARVYIGISETDLTTIINRADRIIDDYFANFDSKPTSSYKADWSAWLSASMYLRQYATATEENMERAKELYDLAMRSMEAYKENTLYNEEESYPTRNYVYKVNG